MCNGIYIKVVAIALEWFYFKHISINCIQRLLPFASLLHVLCRKPVPDEHNINSFAHRSLVQRHILSVLEIINLPPDFYRYFYFRILCGDDIQLHLLGLLICLLLEPDVHLSKSFARCPVKAVPRRIAQLRRPLPCPFDPDGSLRIFHLRDKRDIPRCYPHIQSRCRQFHAACHLQPLVRSVQISDFQITVNRLRLHPVERNRHLPMPRPLGRGNDKIGRILDGLHVPAAVGLDGKLLCSLFVKR